MKRIFPCMRQANYTLLSCHFTLTILCNPWIQKNLDHWNTLHCHNVQIMCPCANGDKGCISSCIYAGKYSKKQGFLLSQRTAWGHIMQCWHQVVRQSQLFLTVTTTSYIEGVACTRGKEWCLAERCNRRLQAFLTHKASHYSLSAILSESVISKSITGEVFNALPPAVSSAPLVHAALAGHRHKLSQEHWQKRCSRP